jgi:hypothetical protein
VAKTLKVSEIGFLVRRSVGRLPTNGDDVDAELAWPRSQGWLKTPQAAGDAVQLRRADAPLGCRMVGPGFDFDGNPAAAAPRQNVDLTARQLEVAFDDAITQPTKQSAGEIFAVLARVVRGLAATLAAKMVAARMVAAATWRLRMLRSQ